MVKERHVLVHDDEMGRIIYMDSITHANQEFGPDDVLIGGSWMGVVPVSFAVRFSPRGVICNDAAVGNNGGGINGLFYLDGMGIPGAAASSSSCEIANGKSHWETGVISYANHWALACGCKPGMSVQEGARALLKWSDDVKASAPGREARNTVYQGEKGEIVTVDSIKFVAEKDRGKVVVIGSHGGATSCGYAIAVRPRALITSDGGGGRDGAGTRGLYMLDEEGIPGVAVSVHSAAIGDGLGIYERGVISTVNKTAEAMGVVPGMLARDAGLKFLG